MPHLSPLKWIYLYFFMILWTMIFLIKINFMFNFYPQKYSKQIKKKYLNWKI